MGAGYLVPVESDRAAEISPVLLGRDGMAFMRAELAGQGRALSQAILAQFGENGKVFAPLEKGENLESAKGFAVGRSRPTMAIRTWLANAIQDRWQQAGVQLIVEDPWATPDDVLRRPPDMPYFFSSQGVYYAPDSADIYASLMAAQRQSNFLFFGFVLSPAVLLPAAGANVGQDNITVLAQHTRAVFASAYDHEGYVVWQSA